MFGAIIDIRLHPVSSKKMFGAIIDIRSQVRNEFLCFISTTDMSQERVVHIPDIKGLTVIIYLNVDKTDRV
jgi:hypothetical protein